MPDNILTSLNWLDLLVILVVIGAVFRGAAQGFAVEIFKILGVFLGTVLSVHFYWQAANILKRSIAVPIMYGELVSFVVIVILIMLIFRLVGQGWLAILKTEAKPGLSQWGGGFLGVFQGILLSGLIFFFIFLLGHPTLDNFVKRSVCGQFFSDLSPKVYKATYDGFIVKFFPQEMINPKLVPFRDETKVVEN